MERRKFIKHCCYTALALPSASVILTSCSSIYYASASRKENILTVAKSEFIQLRKDQQKVRSFVLLKTNDADFPICLYRHDENNYTAALLKCTHRGCELNVGGGIYSCPCHGSEFSVEGKVLEGPAEQDLKLYTTESDNENIYVRLS